jgi:hypothetical protein
VIRCIRYSELPTSSTPTVAADAMPMPPQPPGQAAGPQQPDDDEQQADHRAEVGLEHEQRAQQDEDRQQRQQQRAHRQVPPPQGPARARPQRDDELGQLGGLEVGEAQVDPGPGPVELHADARHEHRDQQRRGDEQADRGPAAHQADRQPHRHQQRDEAEDGEDDLVDAGPPGGLVVERGLDRRGGEHHDQADGQEHAGRADDQLEAGHGAVEPGRGREPADRRPAPGRHGPASPGCGRDAGGLHPAIVAAGVGLPADRRGVSQQPVPHSPAIASQSA